MTKGWRIRSYGRASVGGPGDVLADLLIAVLP